MINDLKTFEVKEPAPLTTSQYHKIPYTSQKRLLQVTTNNRSICIPIVLMLNSIYPSYIAYLSYLVCLSIQTHGYVASYISG